MKVEKIKYTDHKLFNDLEIDFKDSSGDILNTIVIIGENGVGKSTLLKRIYDAFKIDECTYKEIGNGYVELTPPLYKVTVKLKDNECSVLHPDGHEYGIDSYKNYPKVVYVPTEINFDNTNKVDNNFNFKPSFQNVIDENITQNIPSFIATKITREIFRNRNKTIFRNSLGQEFDIAGLSSGEKQLFLRALSLKFLSVNNSVILIDSPEIALHPQWQRKIIDVYESIGENNQFIIATNSPYIIDNIECKQLRILKKNAEGIN